MGRTQKHAEHENVLELTPPLTRGGLRTFLNSGLGSAVVSSLFTLVPAVVCAMLYLGAKFNTLDADHGTLGKLSKSHEEFKLKAAAHDQMLDDTLGGLVKSVDKISAKLHIN